jgi:hypothetical protein
LIYYIITTHNFAVSLSFKASLEFIKSLMAVIILSLMLVHQETQNKGHKPQIMKNQIVHHYRIFSLDISDYERMTEQAMTTLPKLMTEVQTRAL